MSGEHTYEYIPLPGPEHVRLLRLNHTPENSTPLTATLEIHCLDDKIVPYTTLSYSWGRNSDGDALLSQSLRVGDGLLYITENLFDGLRQIRRRAPRDSAATRHESDDFTLLWVDAVCIDQRNVLERNQQVSMVARIYGCGSRMVIWLGEDHHGDGDIRAHRALRVFDNVAENPRYGPLLTGDKASARNFVMKTLWYLGSGSGPDDQHLADIRSIDHGQWLEYSRRSFKKRADLAKLLSRRYFFRLWTVQERYHSTDQPTTIRWGSYEMDVDDFTKRIACYMSWWPAMDNVATKTGFSMGHIPRPSSDLEVGRKFDIVVDFFHTIRSWHTEDQGRDKFAELHSLLFGLSFFAHMSCSDDRDRLYALASLANDSVAIEPDYTASTGEVYSRFARTLVQHGWEGNMLTHAARQRAKAFEMGEPLSADLPSWVPDLRLLGSQAWQDERKMVNTGCLANVSTDGLRLSLVLCLFPANNLPNDFAESVSWSGSDESSQDTDLVGVMRSAANKDLDDTYLLELCPVDAKGQVFKFIGYFTFKLRLADSTVQLIESVFIKYGRWRAITLV